MCQDLKGLVTVSVAAVALLAVAIHPVSCWAQDVPVVTVVEEDFAEDRGVFRLVRSTEEDIVIAGGTLSLIGQNDGNVRTMDAYFGGPLPGRVAIATRQRADEGAYGGLYIYAGNRNVIQIGIGQGRGREGLMVEIDNWDREIRQVTYPDIGTKQQWRDYLVEVDGDQVVVTVDGNEVVSTTFSGQPLERVAIWNGMHSLGAIEVDSIEVTWEPEQMAAPIASFRDDFSDEENLAGWLSTARTLEPGIVEEEDATNGRALHIDFRRERNWTFVHETPVLLEPRTQYELTMRVRGVGGTMGFRLMAQQMGSPDPLARIDTRSTSGYAERTATFVTGSRQGLARLAITDAGRGEVWVDSIELRPADPPRDPHETGVNILQKTIHTPGHRVGLMIEAESAAAAEMVTEADVDGDGLWTLVEFEMPERVISDVAVNPWQFSNNTVLKSDSEAGGEPLTLRFPTVLPGRYRAYLSNPRREMALLEGDEWVRVGDRGEYDLGVVEVDEDFEIVVAHRYRDEDNPGPVYLDYVRFLPLPDEAVITAQARAMHEARMAAIEASWDSSEASFEPVTLTVPERAGIARVDERVITGLPFAAGELQAGAALRLIDGGGAPVTFSAEPLVHWPDGSVKWLRLRFRIDLPAGGEASLVLQPAAGGQPLSRSLSPEGLGAGAVIETDALRVTLGANLIDEVVADPQGDARTMLTGPVSARIAVDDRDAEYAPVLITGYRVLESGLHGQMVDFEGALDWDGPQIGVQGRLLVEQSRPAMTLEAWLVHTDVTSRLQLHEAELVLGGTPSGALMTIGIEAGQFERPLDDGWAVVQDGEGYSVAEFEGVATVRAASGELAWEGERVPGWMTLSGDEGSVAVGVREMTERYPKALSAAPEGDGARISFGIWPAVAEEPFAWNQGVALAHHIGIAFADGEIGADEARTLLAATTHPLRAVATPEHYCASGAFGPLRPRAQPATWPAFEAEVDRAFSLIVSARSAWGMEDFGGVFQPGGYVPGTRRMWTNMEYDFPHATLAQFARTARVDMLERADQATRHFTPIDLIHWSRNERDLGGSRTHSHSMEEGHQVGGANFGHGGWPQGPLQVYYLTGERQGLDAGILISGYIARNSGPRPEDTGGRPMYGLREERDAGNAILTSITTYEATGAPELIEVVYRVLDFVERCQNPDRGNWDTPITEDPPHRGTTFMLHQLIKGLDAMQQVTGEPRVETILARLSTWLLTEAIDDRYRYAHKYSPRYWRGRNVRNFPRYALGLERGARFSSPETAAALREQAVASMEALFGPLDEVLRNCLFETDTADSGAHTAARVHGGEAGEFHDYALTVRGREVAFEVNGQLMREVTFSGQPARWLRLWSGTRSEGPIEIESFEVARLGADGAAETVVAFDFEDPEQLAQWSPRVPENTDSRIAIADGRLVLIDTEQALMGAELDLPEDLGPDYRIIWRQSMPEDRYGGLMVFGPGDFEFDLYRHRPVAILHVGLNQADSVQYAGIFDNPRSFAPNVTYLLQLLAWLEEDA